MENSTELFIKAAILKDLNEFKSACFDKFNDEKLNLKFKDFRSKWEERDFDLLAHFSSTETVLACLVQMGLFCPTRPFTDHQFLIFFLFSLFKCSGKKAMRLSADRVQVLLGIRMRARLQEQEGEETFEILETLFRWDAFVITVEDGYERVNSSTNFQSAATSLDQIQDRIRRIENFLTSNPLLHPQKFNRASINRLRGLLDRYYETKRKACIGLEEEQDFGTVFGGILRVVEGYEKFLNVTKVKGKQAEASLQAKSVRSRLSQSLLTPIAINSTVSNNTDFFASNNFNLTRSNSVPVTRMRRASSMRGDLDLEGFMEEASTSATDMPDINNFY